jgi:hypothetical protein
MIINIYQQINNKEIIEKSIDMANKYQQQITNTIKTISDNYIEAQKNYFYIIYLTNLIRTNLLFQKDILLMYIIKPTKK